MAAELLPSLSEHERQRAARMQDGGSRAAFVIGRARVRAILAGYVSQPAGSLDVAARSGDRPVLAGAPPGFDFSFSRCAHLHVCAVGVNRRLGVDVEVVGSGRDAADIAATHFADDERAWLASRDPRDRPSAFTGIWVKKEAFAKALGAGLRLPLNAFQVPLDGDGWISSPGTDGRHARWRVRTFVTTGPAAGGGTVVGAVVAEGDWRLTVVPWPGPPGPSAG